MSTKYFVRDGLFVERCNPHCKRVDESIELRVRQSTIDVTIKFSQIASNIVCPKQHFQRTSSAYKARQSRHRSAARDQAAANFPLRQDRLFATRKAEIARQRKLASHPRRAPADRDDRDYWSAAEACKQIGKRLQASGPEASSLKFRVRRASHSASKRNLRRRCQKQQPLHAYRFRAP